MESNKDEWLEAKQIKKRDKEQIHIGTEEGNDKRRWSTKLLVGCSSQSMLSYWGMTGCQNVLALTVINREHLRKLLSIIVAFPA